MVTGPVPLIRWPLTGQAMGQYGFQGTPSLSEKKLVIFAFECLLSVRAANYGEVSCQYGKNYHVAIPAVSGCSSCWVDLQPPRKRVLFYVLIYVSKTTLSQRGGHS